MDSIVTPMRLALVVAVVALSSPAAAQQPDQQSSEEAMQGGMTEERDLADEQARLHFRAGRGLYDAGRFQQAAEGFEEAFRLSQRPELLFNAYVAYRDANDLEGAVRSLGAYLEHAQDVPDRVNLTARLESMTQALEERQAREAALAETQRREQEAAARRACSGGGEIWPWIVMGGGVLVAAAGAVTGGFALEAAGSLAAECPNDECPRSVDLDGRRSNAQALGISTDVLLFGGGAIAVTGLVLGIVLNSGGAPADSEQPAVSAACGPTGCGATLRGSF